MYMSLKLRGGRLLALAAAVAVLLAAPRFSRATRAVSAQAPAPKTVCLTFDDGPSRYTPEILEVLAAYDVPATFFVTGQNEDFFSLIAEAARQGHQIALHTYTHDFSEIYASSEAFWRDVDRLQALIVEQTGAPANTLRFAGGSSNTVSRRFGPRGLMKTLCAECGARGLVYCDWNVDTKDAESGVRAADSIAERAVNGARKQDCAVILMHDGTLAQNAAAALERIIPALLAEGFVFARLDALAQPVHHALP